MLPLAETATAANDILQTTGSVPVIGGAYPWGASAADEAAVFTIYALGKRWIDAHYDDRLRELRETVNRLDDT